MNFEDFVDGYLAEGKGKLFAYSKDGVRKEVKSDAEAAEWRNHIAKPAKPPKEKTARAPAPSRAIDLDRISWIIMGEVGNHYPDSDGWDAIAKQIRQLYPHLKQGWDITEVMNKACKKHLKAKTFGEYVDTFHDDHKHLMDQDHV